MLSRRTFRRTFSCSGEPSAVLENLQLFRRPFRRTFSCSGESSAVLENLQLFWSWITQGWYLSVSADSAFVSIGGFIKEQTARHTRLMSPGVGSSTPMMHFCLPSSPSWGSEMGHSHPVQTCQTLQEDESDPGGGDVDQVDRVSVTLEGGAGGRPINRPGGGVMRINRHFPYAANQMHVVVLHRELKPMRVYRLNMSFDAAIEDELLGFFRSSYTLQRERRHDLGKLGTVLYPKIHFTNGQQQQQCYLAVTQFSPIHARKAFPCFDEPIYKATFSLSLRHDPQYTSLSNMPIESSALADEDGWVTNRFARTPRMSTYYLAWAVCNFTYKETRTENGVAIRLYARPDAIASGAGDYALHITKRLLGFYQDYFKVQYSLPKLGPQGSICCGTGPAPPERTMLNG
ncbi:Thyrotropin-releasing hormone-degrading ectoenzyme [Takifugu flavidus]|uniref:Thyrotropin-releasing hormone-degrading ectoenzyme n=1 Tax=Takifugu flavidus TaxID=433684 RepID=A0A5C6NBQ6_9TELE|nr:Thyrotropin-releasing hormone-degrading ectoenzyme [Takifugu flavidus]